MEINTFGVQEKLDFEDVNLRMNKILTVKRIQKDFPGIILVGSVGRQIHDLEPIENLSQHHDYDFALSEADAATFNFSKWNQTKKKLRVPGNYQHFSGRLYNKKCCLFVLPQISFEYKLNIKVQKITELLEWQARFDKVRRLYDLARAGNTSILADPEVDTLTDSQLWTPLHYLAECGRLTPEIILSKYPWARSVVLKEPSIELKKLIATIGAVMGKPYEDTIIKITPHMITEILEIPNSMRFVWE
jgi:hypothetical protein